jgi:hypothetical protein
MDTVATFERLPVDYIQGTEHILACPGNSSQLSGKSCDDLIQICQKVVALAGDSYEPKFFIVGIPN